jgi:hypothetical protein
MQFARVALVCVPNRPSSEFGNNETAHPIHDSKVDHEIPAEIPTLSTSPELQLRSKVGSESAAT